MKATEKFPSPLKLDLKGIAPATKFETPNDLAEWLNAELNWYTTIRNSIESHPNEDQLAQQIFVNLNREIQKSWNQLQELISSDADQEALQTFLDSYIGVIKNHRRIYSQSRIARFISDLSKSDPYQALRVAVNYCGMPFQSAQTNSIAKWIRAGAISEIVEGGLNEKSSKLDEMLDDFAAKWSSNFSKIEEGQTANTNSQRSVLAEINSKLEDATASLAAFNEQSKQDIAEGKSKIEAVRLTYKTELTLQAPTTYWREKQIAHRFVAAGWALGFVLLSAALGCFVAEIWKLTALPYLDAARAATESHQPSYGVYLPTLGAAFLSVWILRIISRQLLLHFGLISDSGERVAMVKTFLALMQMPDHVREDDRILILSALFRPSNRTDDDATPPNWFDLLMQRVKP